MADTPQVSGKVKAGTVASVLASGLVTWLVTDVAAKVAVFHDLFSGTSGTLLVAVLVAVFAGLFTFGAGYLAKHLPAELVTDVEDAFEAPSVDVSPENSAPATSVAQVDSEDSTAPPVKNSTGLEVQDQM